jgi:hypothetical protein
MKGITANGGQYKTATWLRDYVSFMTTPDSHNDTYAESFHRDFFANFAKGVPPERCAEGTEGHNTAQIGGFVVRTGFLRSAMHACIITEHRGLTNCCNCVVVLLCSIAPPPVPLFHCTVFTR